MDPNADLRNDALYLTLTLTTTLIMTRTVTPHTDLKLTIYSEVDHTDSHHDPHADSQHCFAALTPRKLCLLLVLKLLHMIT